VDEIAAIIPGDGTDADTTCDIILHWVGGGLQCISETHPAYTPLHYVLLFPYGEVGWHVGIPLHNGQIAHEGQDQDGEPDGAEDEPSVVAVQWQVIQVSHTWFHAYRLFKQEIQNENGEWRSDSSVLLHGGE